MAIKITKETFLPRNYRLIAEQGDGRLLVLHLNEPDYKRFQKALNKSNMFFTLGPHIIKIETIRSVMDMSLLGSAIRKK